MNILAYVSLHYPENCAGSERYLHDVLKELQARGHKVKVITGSNSARDYEGIQYLPPKSNKKRLIRWADVVVSQLGGVDVALDSNNKKPHVVFMPVCTFLNERINNTNTDLLACISKYVYDELDFMGIPRELVRPVTKPENFKVSGSGDAITLINLNENKGGDLLWKLAERMPDRKFIGVIGGYDFQIVKHGIDNVTLYDNSPDILEIYKQTRVLLFPSRDETWGMAAMEAACSGIPIIANPNPGVLESQGDAAIYANRDNVEEYIEAIKMLDNPVTYKEFSDKVIERTKVVNYQEEIDGLEYSLLSLLTKQ